ncbi:MAG: ATP-binding cassette domain-containing protein, partial [Bacteroidota bacterium]
MPEIVLEVKNLSKRYNDLLAVNGVSFQVHRQEIFGILGPNGAGKT